MAAITRLGLDGYGVRRAGSFAGKTEAGAGAHPVGVLSRLGLDGYGVRRTGDFSGKTEAGVGLHPVDILTRLSLDGYGVRRAGDFSGKTVADDAPEFAEHSPGTSSGAGVRTARYVSAASVFRRRLEDERRQEETAQLDALARIIADLEFEEQRRTADQLDRIASLIEANESRLRINAMIADLIAMRRRDDEEAALSVIFATLH